MRNTKIINGSLVLAGRVQPILPAPRREPARLITVIKRAKDLHTKSKDLALLSQLSFYERLASSRGESLGVTLANSSAASQGTGLSDCAALYAKAISNPFGTFEQLPCVPCTPPVETQRWCSKTRGTFGTGEAGYGSLVVAPYPPDNGTAKYCYTNSSFTGATNIPIAAGVGSLAVADTGLPYTAANFANGMQARLVALGVRWRNITAAGQVAGICAAVQVEDDITANQLTFGQVITMPQAVVVPNVIQALKIGEQQNTWNTLVWRPRDMGSLDMYPDLQMAIDTNTNFTMIVVASSTADEPQYFEFEIVEFFEYTGIAISGGVVTGPPAITISDADAVGVDRVLAGAQRAPLDLAAESWAEQISVGIIDAVAHSDSSARTAEVLSGSAGFGVGQAISMANALMGYLLA